MAEVIRMPRMSDTMEEGNIIGWMKKEGEKVEAGETLAEVETDKATMELDSFVDGVLLHIAVKEGPVAIDGIIAIIGEQGEDWQAVLAAESKGSQSSNGAPQEENKEELVAQSQTAPASPEPAASDDKRIKASPLAKSIAKDVGIDLSQINGSGDHGRIVKRDVEAAIAAQKSNPAPAPADKKVIAPPPISSSSEDESIAEDLPVSQMRKVIARRLGESKFSAPHFYLTVEMNMDKAIKMRKRVNEIAPVKISFNDFVLKAAAAALREHPAINSSWYGDVIRRHKEIHLGVAVAVEDGLLVPVVRHADRKSLSQINMEVKELAGKAKERKLHPDEMSGNTFTISNLGMFGIEEFTAIINPPDACIMAIGTIVAKPIVKNGEMVIGNMMKVTLSCDHRVVDGATGAKFLQTFKAIMEDPIRLMV